MRVALNPPNATVAFPKLTACFQLARWAGNLCVASPVSEGGVVEVPPTATFGALYAVRGVRPPPSELVCLIGSICAWVGSFATKCSSPPRNAPHTVNSNGKLQFTFGQFDERRLLDVWPSTSNDGFRDGRGVGLCEYK